MVRWVATLICQSGPWRHAAPWDRHIRPFCPSACGPTHSGPLVQCPAQAKRPQRGGSSCTALSSQEARRHAAPRARQGVLPARPPAERPEPSCLLGARRHGAAAPANSALCWPWPTADEMKLLTVVYDIRDAFCLEGVLCGQSEVFNWIL